MIVKHKMLILEQRFLILSYSWITLLTPVWLVNENAIEKKTRGKSDFIMISWYQSSVQYNFSLTWYQHGNDQCYHSRGSYNSQIPTLN